VQQGWYDVWQRNKYFAASKMKTSSNEQGKKEDKEPFIMVLPPPNITGILHLGHALTATVQDVLARWSAKVLRNNIIRAFK
jgi:valyl-tRNA synthetase